MAHIECDHIDNADFSGKTLLSKRKARLSDTTIKSICKKLRKNKYKKITSLYLSNNYIGNKGIKIFNKFFQSSDYLPKLQKCDLSSNEISRVGFIYFISLIKRPYFEHLIIYGNIGATFENISNIKRNLPGVEYLLDKIIWVASCVLRAHETAESWIDRAISNGNLTHHHANCHMYYFKN
jgi:Leucine-rich repeat (LRR) protein